MIQFQISQDGLGEDAGRIMEMHFTMVLIILGYILGSAFENQGERLKS